jgi:fatty-acyl-CoA synthase
MTPHEGRLDHTASHSSRPGEEAGMDLRDLKRHAAEQGRKPCIVHWSEGVLRTIRFDECDALSDRLGAAVKKKAKPGPRVVLIILKHHALQLPLFLGCLKGGLIPSFLPFPSAKQDPTLFWRTQAIVFERSDAALVITYGELVARVSALIDATGIPAVNIDDLEKCGATGARSLPHEDDIALLQHSSGTTGLSKGVALSYRQVMSQIRAYAVPARLAGCGKRF